jgi:hypothetical protein
MARFSLYNTIYQFENAEMTPQLCDDLINFSFDDLQDAIESCHIWNSDMIYSILILLPFLLAVLKKLVCVFTHAFSLYLHLS